MGEIVAAMERWGELEVSPEVRAKLLRVSAATIDRLVEPERRRLRVKGRSGTKPGSLLKRQIPAATKDRLRALYTSLNPVDLKRCLTRCQDELLAVAKQKSLETRKEVRTSPTHPWKATLWPEKTPLGGHFS